MTTMLRWTRPVRPTRKFFLFRDVIQRRTGITPPALPAPLPVAAIAGFPLTESAPLWSNLPAPVAAEHPRSMETFGQDYGYILYRKQVLDRLRAGWWSTIYGILLPFTWITGWWAHSIAD